ncbi:DeoR/GlpR family transcriptional regulator of sugar metabolism [Pseudarthrobacter sp. W1I19]|nr:DeoR/GlpR family transcriptional regulator of sugar metabolism [Pseudarthrobacter sp. W1I19]
MAFRMLRNGPFADIKFFSTRVVPPIQQSFVGPLAKAVLERMSFDRVFLGADAVTAEDGTAKPTTPRLASKSL